MDDDESQLEMFRLFMSSLDKSLDMVSCSDPFEALKLVAADGFDCVVSDYVMPSMSGIELATRVKDLKSIPFILYTGQWSEEVAQQAFQAGADVYIRKEIEPSHYEVLLNSIRHAVDKHRAEQIYKVVFESNPEAILVIIDNVIEYSNLASAPLFGVKDRNELIGRYLTDFLLEQESEEISWVYLQRIVSETRIIPFELTIRIDSGELKLVRGTLQNMYFFGKPAQFYFMRDITVRRDMERGLIRTQHQFDRILNHSLIGIALIDQDFKIERCNRLFTQIFGLTPDCSGFKLMNEPNIYTKVNGRLLPSDSIHFDLTLDFIKLNQMGFLDSQRDDVCCVEMIVSPIALDKDSFGFLVQAREFI